MKNVRLALGAILVLGLTGAVSAQAPAGAATQPPAQNAQTMTQQQLDQEILNELKSIHALLARMATLQPAAQPQAPPRPTRGKLSSVKGFVMGKPNAPLTMVEFTDLQCPFCRQYITSTFGDLKKNWIDTGKLRYISRDFPLSFHPEALPAARAARCAGEQGKFWEMRTTLMSNANLLNADYITKTAQDMKLDMKAFATCTASTKYDAEIQSEEAEGVQLGVTGTPSFLMGKTEPDTVEGPMIVGALPYNVFDQKLKELDGKK